MRHIVALVGANQLSSVFSKIEVFMVPIGASTRRGILALVGTDR